MDKIPSIDELRLLATKTIHDWVFIEGKATGADEEPLEMVRGADHYDRAVKELRLWFENRLLIDPGTPEPFSYIGNNLIAAMLDLVDWHTIVRTMRVRED